MDNNMLERAELALAKKKKRSIWIRIVSVLGCVVVFCTTYALILPAITMTRQTVCGLEEHVHTVQCYETRTVEGETVPVTVKGSERLSLIVSILKDMEACGILGEMKSVDVSNIGHIELWYGDRFQIDLGDENNLTFKIKSAKAAIDSPEMGKYTAGKLDASFTIWPDVVAFSPFDE